MLAADFQRFSRGNAFISTSEIRPQDGCAEILQIHKREIPLSQRGREGASGI